MVLWTALVLAGPVFAGKVASNPTTGFDEVAPCASLLSAARLNGIPVTPPEPAARFGRLAPGDSFTGLITLRERGDRLNQWLVYLEVMTTNAAGKAANPAPMKLWTSLGTKLEFESLPVPASVRTLGPFADPTPPRKPPKSLDKQARFSTDEGFLSLGLDEAAATMSQFSKAKVELFGIGGSPFSEAEIRKSRRAVEPMHITAEQERATVGLVPALLSYVTIVQHTKGLEDLLLRVVDRPSLWSILRQGGVTADLAVDPERIGPAKAGIGELVAPAKAYDFPMTLSINRHRALDITLIVTAPRPPFLTCGGIIGMSARKPGDPETVLTFRIISAHSAATAPSTP